MPRITVDRKISSLACVLGMGGVLHWRKGSYGFNDDCSNSGSSSSRPKSEILFLGTGSSLGTPVACHLMNPDLSDPLTLLSREAARGINIVDFERALNNPEYSLKFSLHYRRPT